MQQSPIGKISQKNRIEISDTPAENTPRETIIETKNVVHGSYHNKNLGKGKSYIDIVRINPKKIQKYNTANSPDEKNEEILKKIQDSEEKPKTISTKPSDTNADVTNRVHMVCDSIVKHIRRYELSQGLENCKVFVESFSGARVRCMEDYIQPTLIETPSHVILHVDTNDVTRKQDHQQIAESIINFAVKIKKNCDVSISSITARNDKYLRKAADVNRYLKDRCREKNLNFKDHGNALSVRHLNASALHLNKTATQVLFNQFAEAISNIIN